MPSQLPRQTDGELAEYDGSLTGDQVFYSNIWPIYFDILWKWIPLTEKIISPFICSFFTEGIFKGASNAEGSCEDWVSQPRRPWGEFFQLEPTVWHIAHQKSYNLDGVDLDFVSTMRHILEVIISKRRWWLRWTHSLPQSSSRHRSHLPRRRGSLGAGVRSSLLGHLASRAHMKINNAFNKLYINNTLKL